MTERGGAIICCRILAHPLFPRRYYLNYLNDKERGAIIFCRTLAPPPPPPHPNTPPPKPQYLTILMTERGGAIVFVGVLAGFWRLPALPRYTTAYGCIDYCNSLSYGLSDYCFKFLIDYKKILITTVHIFCKLPKFHHIPDVLMAFSFWFWFWFCFCNQQDFSHI